MISITILVVLIGCYFLYNTSKKIQLEKKDLIDFWLQENIKKSKWLSLLILLFAFLSSTLYFGLTSGFLFWLFTISIILSLMVLLYPLKIFKKKHILILFIIFLSLEIFLNL